MSGFEVSPHQAETRTKPHSNLVCPNGVPVDGKLCLLLLSHLQALLKPRLLHMGESRCRFIQITWYSCKGRAEEKWAVGRRHGRHWVKDHTYRSNTSQSNFTDTTSHSFVIWSSLNMQQAQGVNRHFPQSSGSLSRNHLWNEHHSVQLTQGHRVGGWGYQVNLT